MAQEPSRIEIAQRQALMQLYNISRWQVDLSKQEMVALNNSVSFSEDNANEYSAFLKNEDTNANRN